MAWPWLAIVARNIPWTELARRAPQIISASSELLDKRKATARADVTTPPDEADEIELEKRIRSLEQRGAQDARLIEQLAQDMGELSEAVQVLAARLRLLAFVVAAIVIFGIFSVLFVA